MHSDNLHQRTDPNADPAGNRIQSVKPTLAIVGAGKVAATLARLYYTRGYRIETVYNRTFERAETLARLVGAEAVRSLNEVRGDLALITVTDGAIQVTAEALSGFKGKAAVHASGAFDAGVLKALAARGIQVGGLHPVFPFNEDVDRAVDGLPGATFAVEAAEEPLLGWLREMVLALDGRILVLPPGGRALYHAALVMAGGYAMTLYGLAERLLVGLGAEKDAADHALNGLLAGVVDNLRDQGVPAALAGPLVRTDVVTISAHLAALRRVDSAAAETYIQLARLTYPLLLARGIAQGDVARIEQIFQDSTGM